MKWRAYLELCKPRVVALMLLTVIVGMYLATPGWVALVTLMWTTLGIGLVAGSAATVNHILDHRIDALMRRTQGRPLPTGQISQQAACGFAIVLGVIGLLILLYFVNTLTASLTLLSLIGYAGIYTLYLKRATPQNIVIGGLAGAAPPLLGWTAVTNHIDPHSLLLVLIIFVWTPPHFWALAIHRYQDYAKADIPMLPVTHGIPYTKRSIFLYTVLLMAVSLLPFATHMSGGFYVISAVLLGAGFIYWAWILMVTKRENAAIRTFHYSIFYLMTLFIVLLLDHYWINLER
jgi:protoheme IX farnesyltransferase